jgi:hypothetical protein
MLNQSAALSRVSRALAAAVRSARRWACEQRRFWERRLERLGGYLADAARSGPPADPSKNPNQPHDLPEESQ